MLTAAGKWSIAVGAAIACLAAPACEAGACVGGTVEYSIDITPYKPDPTRAMVSYQTKTIYDHDKERPVERRYEILDDDGYLSAYFAYIKLMRNNQPGELVDATKSATRDYLLKRLQIFERYVDANFMAVNFGRPAAREQMLEMKAGIGRTRAALASWPVKEEELFKAFRGVRRYPFSYQTRQPGAQIWNAPGGWRSLNMIEAQQISGYCHTVVKGISHP